MNKYQKALERIQKSKLIFHVYKGQTEGMKTPRIFDLYHGEIFTLRELVEKATPKRPKTYCDDYSYFDCPSCGMTIGFMNEREEHHYCLNCGQALSWSESEEE